MNNESFHPEILLVLCWCEGDKRETFNLVEGWGQVDVHIKGLNHWLNEEVERYQEVMNTKGRV